MSQDKTNTQPSLDHLIFWPAFILISASSILLLLFPEASTKFVGDLKFSITHSLDWLYLLVSALAFVFALWLAFGRYGNIKLGKDDELPEYSNIHWIAMMFTAGIGSGIIVWGFAEPVFYLKTPPFGIEPFSQSAQEMAHMYPLFHWGILPWAIYVIPAVPIAYQLYVKEAKEMRISNACDAALPQGGRGAIKWLLDVFIIIGIVGGTVTALGLGVPLISALVSETFGIADNNTAKLAILGTWTLLITFSVANGLKKGIKVLADLNMVLAVVAIIFILIAGPTLFILGMGVNSFGLMLDNFIKMSFWTDPIANSGFPEDWTVFYWAWWIAFSAFVGLFIARISRGRTIKQLILGVIGWGSLGTWLFLIVTGAYSLHLEISGELPVSDLLANDGMSAMTAQIIATLPFSKLILGLFIVLGMVFAATCIDSAAYIISSVCSKEIRNDQEPQLWTRMIWTVSLALLTSAWLSSALWTRCWRLR